MKYVNFVLKRHCYEELSVLFAKTNSPIKEISESYGAFHHMKNALSKDGYKMDDFFFIHVGDGSTCRTGALFTFMSKSYNISVDPNCNIDIMRKWIGKYNVERFDAYKDIWQNRVKDIVGDFIKSGKKHLAIMSVHAHVRTIDLFNAFPETEYFYVNPCCKPKEQLLSTQQAEKLNIGSVICGNDNYILSEKNFVTVYKRGD